MTAILIAIMLAAVLLACSPEISEWVSDKLDELFGDDNWPTGGGNAVTP